MIPSATVICSAALRQLQRGELLARSGLEGDSGARPARGRRGEEDGVLWMRSHLVRWLMSVLRRRTFTRRSRMCAGAIHDSGGGLA